MLDQVNATPTPHKRSGAPVIFRYCSLQIRPPRSANVFTKCVWVEVGQSSRCKRFLEDLPDRRPTCAVREANTSEGRAATSIEKDAILKKALWADRIQFRSRGPITSPDVDKSHNDHDRSDVLNRL